MCIEAVLKSQILVKKTSTLALLRVIKTYDKSASMLISAVVAIANTLTAEEFPKHDLFFI